MPEEAQPLGRVYKYEELKNSTNVSQCLALGASGGPERRRRRAPGHSADHGAHPLLAR